MKLGQVAVGHEVGPLGTTPRPPRLVYKNRHGVTSLLRCTGTLGDMGLAKEQVEAGASDTDVISLTIPASTRFVRLARIAVASIARRRGLSVRAIDDLRLAVDEAFALLLSEEDHDGSVEVTFEVDRHELLVAIVQRIPDGPAPVDEEIVSAFEVIIADLVDRCEADPALGVVQFSKLLKK